MTTIIHKFLVFQFTLYCELKGNKPDYRHAMGGEAAQQLYQTFLTQLSNQYNSDMVKGTVGQSFPTFQ